MKFSSKLKEYLVLEEAFRKLPGGRLHRSEKIALKKWEARSPHHAQVVRNFRNPTWLGEQLRQRLRDERELDVSDIWEKVTTGLEAKGYGPFPRSIDLDLASSRKSTLRK